MTKSDKPLSKRELEKLEKNTIGWKLAAKNTKLVKTFEFEKHIDALIFIARITVHTELLHHHPDIQFTYCKAKITLTSHEQKALTKKDLALLSRIEKTHLKLSQVDNA
jgi:pterin-4a-carbinolamine dehydratase